MSLNRKLSLGVGGLLVALVVQADVLEPKETPYKVILERNPFGLKEPPPPPTNPATTAAAVVNIKLTGITSNSSGKKAWLMIPPQPGKSPTPLYLSIPERDKQGEIEVLEINEQESTVRILNAGVPATLNFKEHGVASPAAPPVLPGAPGAMPGAIPVPGVPSPMIRTASATPNSPVPTYNVTAQPAGTVAATANPALRTIPARNVRTTPIEPQPQAVQPQPAPQTDADPAVQYIILKAQEQEALKSGKPFPPIPPLPGAPSQ